MSEEDPTPKPAAKEKDKKPILTHTLQDIAFEEDPRKELNAWIRAEALVELDSAWQAQRRLMRALVVKAEEARQLARKTTNA